MYSDQELRFEADIEPGETKTIRVHPKHLFRGMRLTVEDSNFLVTSLSVGPDSRAKIFGSWVSMDTCDPSVWIQIQAENKSTEKRFFKALLEGYGGDF